MVVFQSLFLWIFRSYADLEDELRVYKQNVSILVLMDLPFLQSHIAGMENAIFGFNPCSYGSSVLTSQYGILNFCDEAFQSLFLWIFRSYFEAWSGATTTLDRVSILVLMDLPFLPQDQ